uniref:Adaptor related protein complex 5 subunit sigma 1 n=2 Tax=Tetraodon nigroviridis TaxID=99883 RepID=H3CYY0_TETNG
MVRCFLIHTVCPVGALGPGDSRVLYSRLFGPNEAAFSEQHRELEEEERRLLQKEAVALVARQVRSAVRLSREASGRPLGESEPGEEALALQEADGGVRRLRAGEPFCGETSALWLAVHGLAFTLVCEAHENLLLAEGSLRSLSRHCLEQLHLLGPGPEVLLRSDRVDGCWTACFLTGSSSSSTTALPRVW